MFFAIYSKQMHPLRLFINVKANDKSDIIAYIRIYTRIYVYIRVYTYASRYEGSGASQMGLRLEGVSIQDAGIWRLRSLLLYFQTFTQKSWFENISLTTYSVLLACHRIRHNNNWVEASFELIVTEYGLTNTEPNSPISIEVLIVKKKYHHRRR